MESLVRLLPRLDPNQGCTKATCDASKSIYGYEPDLAATIIFLVVFAASGALHLWQGIATRTYFFSIAMAIGCLASVFGYVAKLLLHNDPFSDVGFKMSVVVLTFAPAFFAAGIYFTLKHMCLTFGSSFSRLKPSMYTTVFISCDIFSIVLQAIGGGLASASKTKAILKVGDNVMITGLSVQVATMLAFGALALDYALAAKRNWANLNPATATLRSSLRFKIFLAALWISYFCILARCCYRLAELAKGWSRHNDILRNENLFIGLDSVTCSIATVILNFWHPGWCFPGRVQEFAAKSGRTIDSSDEEAVMGTETK